MFTSRGRTIIALIALALVAGWILFLAANTASYRSALHVDSEFRCPAGSTIKETYQQPYPGAGDQDPTLRCVDANGNPVPSLPGDRPAPPGFRFYFPPGLLIVALLVLAWLLWSAHKTSPRR